MSYKHFNLEQRNIIAYMRNVENRAIQYIANSIGVHKSTVSREIKRNSIVQRDAYWNYNTFYIPQVAVDLYLTRRSKKVKEKLTPEYISIIKKLLKKDYSPEQISGSERKYNKNFPSSRTIYNYIYDNEIKIPKRYRLKLKKRAQAKNSPVKNKELFCHSIHESPDKIYSRSRFAIKNKIQIYYTDPGAPHQKGLVEYTNKLLRKYIFNNKVFDENIIRPLKVYTKIINSRPKKEITF